MRALVALVVVSLAAPGARADDEAAIVLFSAAEPASAAAAKSRGDLAAAGYRLVTDSAMREALEAQALGEAAPLEQARALLAKARHAYESFEHAAARSTLADVSQLIESYVWDAAPRALLADRYLLEGLIDFNDGNPVSAMTHFRLAHRLEPKRSELDPATHRPGVIETYARAVESNVRATGERPVIDVQPRSATVFVDGAPVARGAEISAGPHLVVVAYPGYSAKARVWMASDASKLSVQLVPDSAESRIRHLRREVSAGSLSVAAATSEIFDLARVKTLLLVRVAGSRVEVAIARQASSDDPEWVPFGGDAYFRALRQAKSKPEIVVAETANDDDAPWYGTWWGIGILATGTVAVLSTGLYFAIASNRESSSVVVDQWCFEECM